MESKVEIYQTNYEKVVFRDLNYIKSKFELNNEEDLHILEYQKVYSNNRFATEVKDEYDILDEIFYLFNNGLTLIQNKMRSVSVSDIIKLNGKYYYCDNIGFKLLDLNKKKVGV